jgi:hypothetical protein
MELGTDCLCLRIIEQDIKTLESFQLGLHVTGQSSHGTMSPDAAKTVCLVVGRVLFFTEMEEGSEARFQHSCSSSWTVLVVRKIFGWDHNI